MNDADRGLYDKYQVTRRGDTAGKHRDCRYYVLDLVHDRFAAAALTAYAAACEDEFPTLSAELLLLVGVRR